LSGESHATSSDGVCNCSNIEVEEDVDVKEEGFIAVNDEVVIGIKLEEIPEDFPDIKSEADEVSYVCVCVCVCYFWPLKSATMLGMKVFCSNFFLWGVLVCLY
jgi:hypothetical protein